MKISGFPQPFTPRGVAAFAREGLGILLMAWLLAALAAGAASAWCLQKNCFSVAGAAIERLPDAGDISFGRLHWRGESPEMLVEGRVLAVDVDLDHSGVIRSTCDGQVEFGAKSMRVYSLIGYWEAAYPPHGYIPFNRPALEPLWNAWAPLLPIFSAAVIAIGLLLCWTVLAAVYFFPVRLAGFFMNRHINLMAAWKLSAAALLPGALVMTGGVLLYNAGWLQLAAFGGFFVAHFVIGWIYAAMSLVFVPRATGAPPKGNPFKKKR